MSKREGKKNRRLAVSSREKKNITSLVLTAFIIFALILSGPALAVNISLSNFPSTITAGDDVNFLLNVAIDAGENIPISNVTLFIRDNSSGAVVDTFSFYPNGVIITPSTGLTVDVLDSSGLNFTYGNRYGYGYGDYWYGYGYGYSFYDYADFGYGYGYGYDTLLQTNLTYNITIAGSITQTYSAGNYTIQAYVYTGEDNVLQAFLSGETFFSVTEVVIPVPTADVYVDVNGTCSGNTPCFDTIHEAIDNASTGDSIYVLPGNFTNERIRVNKSVNLIGAGANSTYVSSFSGSQMDHVFIVNVSNVNISGFNITNGVSCIFLNRSNYTRIFNNTMTRCNYGVYSNFSNNNTFMDNLVLDNYIEGMYITRYSNSNVIKNTIARLNDFRGIFLESSSNNTILNNTANSNENIGILIDSSSNYNYLINNTASQNSNANAVNDTIGIYLNRSNYNIIQNNTASLNQGHGLIVGGGIGNNLTNNSALSNYESGIYLFNSNSSVLDGNNANLNADYGYIIWSSNSNTITDNNASYNTVGILFNTSSLNSITNFSAANNSLSGIYMQNSNGNMIKKSSTWSNSISGIYTWDSGNNYIYDNFFNNSVNNKFVGTNLTNDWNTTKIAGNNIINKPLIAGNFWANPTGTGTSQTCTDDNGDGICDSSYTLAANNTDYLPLSINSSVITVCLSGSCNFTTIQGAVDAASNGKIITVLAGTYNENVDVNKSLELFGAGASMTFVNATNPSDHTFNLTATSTNLSGFTIQNATGTSYAGIYITANNASILNNNISKNYYGIRIVLANGNSIHSNNISSNSRSIDLLNSSSNQIINNSASHNTAVGISLFGSSNFNTITNNSANNNGQNGIHVNGSHNNYIRYNSVISNSQNAILISSSNFSTIKDNNASKSAKGIYLERTNHNTIVSNDASGNIFNGIYLESSRNSTINNNIASSNIQSGIYLISNSASNVTNNTANSNLDVGIFILSTNSSTLANNTANSNQDRGVRFDYSNQNSIINNTLLSNGWGVHAFKSHNNIINNNIANSNDEYGIRLCFSENSSLRDNIADSNAYGIRLCLYSHNNTVTNSIARSNTYYGLELNSSENNTVLNNTLESSLYGISFESANNTIIINNTIKYNAFGLFVNSSTNNTLYNNLLLNLNNIRFVDRIYNNTWNTTRTTIRNIVNGTVTGGNFWAYPNGTGFSQRCADTDVDGICDLSFNLTSRNTDFLPLSTPVDFVKPTVWNLSLSPSNIIQIKRNITISANITDDYSVGAASINITRSGYAVGTGDELMTLNSSTGHYQYRYNVTRFGKHIARINATDLSGKYNDSVTINFFGYLVLSNLTNVAANGTVTIINESNNIEVIAAGNTTGDATIGVNASVLPVDDGIFATIGINASNSNAETGTKYLNITNTTSLENLSNFTIRLYYSSDEISGIVEGSLGIYYSNGTKFFKLSDYVGGNVDNNSAYPYVFAAGLNTTEKFAYATIDHFSEYALAGTNVVTTTPGGAAGGGGGGGAPSKPKVGPAVSSESTISFSRIDAGKTAWGIFSEKNSPIISSIRITVRNDVEFIFLTLSYLLERPSETPDIDRLVRGYFLISKSDTLKELDVKKAVINFRLEKEWLKENDVDINTVTLLRYANGQWNIVDTAPVVQDANYIYFKSDTPGFSYFAIAASANSGYEFSLATLKEQSFLELFKKDDITPLNPQEDGTQRPGDITKTDKFPLPPLPKPTNTFLTTLLILLLGSGAAYFYWKSLNK